MPILSHNIHPWIEAVVDSGVSRRLVELLMCIQHGVSRAALRAVGNIATGDNIQTQVLIKYGALPCLLQLLKEPKHSKEFIRKSTEVIQFNNLSQFKGNVSFNLTGLLDNFKHHSWQQRANPGRHRHQHFPDPNRHSDHCPVQDTEGGGLGHHQRHQRGHCGASQVKWLNQRLAKRRLFICFKIRFCF